MRVEFPRPNQPLLVCEEGDMIGLMFVRATPDQAVTAVRPIPLGPSMKMVWAVPADDCYGWGLFDPSGQQLMFVGDPLRLRKGDEYVFAERKD